MTVSGRPEKPWHPLARARATLEYRAAIRAEREADEAVVAALRQRAEARARTRLAGRLVTTAYRGQPHPRR